MDETRRRKLKVEAIIKEMAPGVIVQRSFYDDASDRLFVSLVKGPRKTEIVLSGHDFNNGELGSVRAAIKQGVERLERVPIG
ncbi:MAG TPA: hypothetical protein VNO70_10895 [Blastocatellia bacterium]|nr:hypothetical protein [Blastocatellia bacterium]